MAEGQVELNTLNGNDQEWSCPVCTYSNQSEAVLCAMCRRGIKPDAMSDPLLVSGDNRKQELQGVNCCVCCTICLIIMIIPCSYNIYIWSNMGENSKYHGVTWNATVLSISVVFCALYCILYALYSRKRIHAKILNFYCWTVTIFAIFAGVVAFWFLILPALLCTCFAADSMVWVQHSNNTNINKMALRDLQIGDYILTMDPVTNDVFWEEVLVRIHYSWYDNGFDYYSMRKLYLENNITSITLSTDHFVFINNNITNTPKVVAAESVEIGDLLFYYDYDTERKQLVQVTEIEEHVMRQKRVFFTSSQYVLVDGIVASPFVGPDPMYHDILHNIFISNTMLIRYVWPHFMSSAFSFIGLILMYSSYFIIIYWFELFTVAVSILLCVTMWRQKKI